VLYYEHHANKMFYSINVMKGVSMLEFINVTKQFETVTAVKDISFTLNDGTVLRNYW